MSENRLSEAAFANAIGVSQAAVNRYTKNRIPQSTIMKRILKATAGAVTANDFYGIEVNENPHRKRK